MILFRMIWVFLMVLSWTCPASGQTATECGGFAADIMFLLDTSSSIEPEDFIKQLKFTQDVVKIFDISRRLTKVGVSLFSTTVYPEFGLDDFNSKGHIVNRIGAIRHRGGKTNTAEALSYLRTKVFTNDQQRQGVPRIAIILTDGFSNYPEKTAREATELHLNGITVFVIGIGSQVDKAELKAIATNPDKDYVFNVNNFDALVQIKKTLAIKTCEVEYQEPVVQQDILNTDTFCGGRLPCSVSIVYGADISSASIRVSQKIMAFFTMVNDKLQEQLSKVRSSQIINNCPVGRSSTRRRRKNYAPLLQSMRQASPASLPRLMNPGKAMNVIVIDTRIGDLADASKEVLRARFKRQDTFVVVVGTEINRGLLERLLRIRRGDDKMFSQHVFAVDNYDKLPAAISPLVGSIKTLKCG